MGLKEYECVVSPKVPCTLSMELDWGTKRADEMGVEAFVESTELAKPLYVKHGFVLIDYRTLKPTDPNSSEEWRRLERELLPMNYHFMWRPIGGRYENGRTVIPWETKAGV